MAHVTYQCDGQYILACLAGDHFGKGSPCKKEVFWVVFGHWSTSPRDMVHETTWHGARHHMTWSTSPRDMVHVTTWHGPRHHVTLQCGDLSILACCMAGDRLDRRWPYNKISVLCGFRTWVVPWLHLRWPSVVRDVSRHGPRDALVQLVQLVRRPP